MHSKIHHRHRTQGEFQLLLFDEMTEIFLTNWIFIPQKSKQWISHRVSKASHWDRKTLEVEVGIFVCKQYSKVPVVQARKTGAQKSLLVCIFRCILSNSLNVIFWTNFLEFFEKHVSWRKISTFFDIRIFTNQNRFFDNRVKLHVFAHISIWPTAQERN